jgi:hypothetical protein
VTIDVVGCGEANGSRPCPFHATAPSADRADRCGIRETCLLAQRRIDSDESERPEWCPLESGEVIVRLRAR